MLRIILDPPWSIRVQDGSPLCLVAMVSGGGWIVPGEGSAVRVGAGDVAIIRGSEPYVLADDPATPPHVLVHPGQRCATLDGRDLHEQMTLGVRTWGSGPNGSMTMLLGVYEDVGAVGQRDPGLPAGPGDPHGRARPGGPARPAARPAADLGAA
jgi:hypothetical protein